MSLPTWTPSEVSSKARFGSQNVWRMVENQHVAATMKIVDTLSEQELLETIIEEQKPAVPNQDFAAHMTRVCFTGRNDSSPLLLK